MAVYVVLSAGASPKLQENIKTHYPDDNHFEVAPNQWLLSTDKIDSTISAELQIADGGVGVNAVVFRIAGTGWGWHKKALWEWLAVKSKA